MIPGSLAHPPATASVVSATAANVGLRPHPTGDPLDTLLLARGMSSRYLSSKTKHRLLPLSRANVESDLRHFEAHRSTCGGYAQQRFVHGNRELAGGGRFVGPALARPAIDPSVARHAIDPAVAHPDPAIGSAVASAGNQWITLPAIGRLIPRLLDRRLVPLSHAPQLVPRSLDKQLVPRSLDRHLLRRCRPRCPPPPPTMLCRGRSTGDWSRCRTTRNWFRGRSTSNWSRGPSTGN